MIIFLHFHPQEPLHLAPMQEKGLVWNTQTCVQNCFYLVRNVNSVKLSTNEKFDPYLWNLRCHNGDSFYIVGKCQDYGIPTLPNPRKKTYKYSYYRPWGFTASERSGYITKSLADYKNQQGSLFLQIRHTVFAELWPLDWVKIIAFSLYGTDRVSNFRVDLE